MMRLFPALLLLSMTSAAAPARASDSPHVVVIGIDGMDPDMLTRFMDAGRMPNFRALISEGQLLPLGTSIPPQSPVAWSNFITGTDPGSHGIFDFIHRDPATYTPIFSAAEIKQPEKTLSLGDWILPLSKGGTVLLRRGEAFWETLERAGVPCTVIRVPANYPPSPTAQKTLSGMGTPDLLGSYGSFTLFTDDPEWEGAMASGGRIRLVKASDGRVTTTIEGPRNSLRRSQPVLECPLTIDVDPGSDAVRVTVSSEEAFLRSGEWSGWLPVEFDLVGPFKKLHGMCRFYLKSTAPLHLYASPINIDPRRPALPISTPEDLASDLAERTGPYYTQGIAEDTKALEAGVFDDAQFVTQTDTIMAERERMHDVLLHDYKDGLLFFYVSTVDQSCHALWRDTDPAHPAHVEGNGFEDRFGELYEEMDRMLGEVRARIPADATIIILSDHGFAPFYKKVNINTWLYQNGYLALIRPEEIGRHPLFGNVFWRRTRAYAAGLNGLYVNLAGREGKGIVPTGPQYDALLDELRAKLLELRDPDTGEQIITTVYKASEVYHGDEVRNAPDLIVGYNRGYRSSDDSALGTVSPDLITLNFNKWTGDHCIDHRWVPGVLISNRHFAVADPSLIDVPTTIIRLFGVDPPAAMKGRNLFAAGSTTAAAH
ncbi:MAG: alkaline phosphatase family protein [Candidatus Krumholzibacteria bacterium]|nr:alkaline phosphatase family protein [Candidatus Krumholzibacteria bacterium]MDH4336429.1 alkaline phosphatase family protein [Candidatus Krumholzibacteria bacterium]MDH5269554.1 alkaline phosphatase family protein [Candidatus Krumholzibacteria bacterium]